MAGLNGEQLRDDLKGVFRGEFRCDPVTRSLYSSDASIFQIRPLAVAAPLDEADLRTLVRYAAQNQIPLTARGAATGMAGESLGRGIVVDLSRHFRRTLDIGTDTVRVQPGVVLRGLNAELGRHGRRFGPDPASAWTCTIGGMIANDASGSRAIRHGTTRDHLAAARVVWDEGTAEAISASAIPAEARTRQIARDLSHLLDARAGLIAGRVKRARFERGGYRLDDIRRDGRLDLSRLLAGSEGTLGLITEAVLRTIPLPGGRSAVRFTFAELGAGLRAACALRELDPSACDLLDRRLAAFSRHRPAEADPEPAEAVLLVEFEADSVREAAALAWRAVVRLRQLDVPAPMSVEVGDTPESAERLWDGRRSALPGLFSMGDGSQPLAFVEDIGLPTESLREFAIELRSLLQRLEVTASFMAHPLAGQVHVRPFLNLNRPEDRARLWPIAEAVHELTWRYGGTICSQHGVGLARTPWLARQAEELLPVWRDLKAIFDPQGILNPGKILGPDPGLPAWPLRDRLEDGSERRPLTTLPFHPEPPDLVEEVARCNGCGECREYVPGRRMCPIFHADPREAASPRAKANLWREALSSPEAVPIGSDAARAVANLCVNCRMCASECPAQVDIPRLMLEAKAANLAEHGLSRPDWVLAWTEGFASFGSTFAPAVNRSLSNPTVRWVMERVFGVSRKRMLPAFARRSFLRIARRRGWTKPPLRPAGEPVALFIDVFANYNDVSIAEAAYAVLRHNGIDVFVPDGQVGCGMALLAQGHVEAAREKAEHNVRRLAELARLGYRIVCPEPTSALMLRHDYPALLGDPDTRAVADRTVELTRYLQELDRGGRLRHDFRPMELSLGHHVPCHLKALGGAAAGPGLLSLIPGLRVRTIDLSCSGMAGTFGLRADNFETSLRAGKPMLDAIASPGVLLGSTECSSCRMQMQHGTGKRTLHPVQYLALSYGLMPKLADRIRAPLGGLVTE